MKYIYIGWQDLLITLWLMRPKAGSWQRLG